MSISAKIITNKGEINLNLMPEISPITVANFVSLINKKFYNDIIFHRVIEDFMIQTGDPTGTGMGGPGYKFTDEFVEGVVFDTPGILAMANAGPNTNGSQIFITHVPTPWLNYHHTIFGKVVSQEDQEVVNSIKQGDKIETIELFGDVDKYLEENEELIKKFNI
ncbi:peptidylprolyl isomerase [Caviibacter abscessus]|uniref:peptidylprolyl isomerase n=1 Tax=Caviibacter abscessus TaxID=1766719 RepID=UPI00082A08F4|nr:peptidylprolyl isomerase [Caviibacter abscessus]